MLSYTPDTPLYEVFEAFQNVGLFEDSKTFVDAELVTNQDAVVQDFLATKGRDKQTLSALFKRHYELPEAKHEVALKPTDSMEEHIAMLWPLLVHQDSVQQQGSSLIAVPKPYVIPGGRFREGYYWDSYFTMLGLLEAGKLELVTGMVDNFAYLLKTYGLIPNGNRTYYLSRSQPPVFAMMVKALEEKKGREFCLKYLPALQREYAFWMDGAAELQPKGQYRRVVKLSTGQVLNRYWDDENSPRPESFREDEALAKGLPEEQQKEMYRNLRAGAESGWDFSARWFRDQQSLSEIHTTEILPVDLNCMLYFLEHTIAEYHNELDQYEEAKLMATKAQTRKMAIQELMWSRKHGFFVDYDWKQEKKRYIFTLAGAWPLYFNLASDAQALKVTHKLSADFLKSGGWVTTLINSTQQWDSPNGWAPLQWVVFKGLENYNQKLLAKKGAQRWVELNRKVWKNTGKMMEKYNVVDADLLAGGGEYPAQDGFGWTNGVVVAMLADGVMEKKKATVVAE